MRVSCITPTWNRADKHAQLLRVFGAQTHEDRELLVWDDSKEPSPVMVDAAAKDARVVYVHDRERMSIGRKRNVLGGMARGEVLVAFDDDDLYAPEYIERMVEMLGDIDLVKLSVWRLAREADGSLWEWDTARTGDPCWCVSGAEEPIALPGYPGDARVRDSWLWGYGFSYCYRKAVHRRARFPDQNIGEDYGFIRELNRAGYRIGHVKGGAAWVTHMLHPRSSSTCFPQRRLDARIHAA